MKYWTKYPFSKIKVIQSFTLFLIVLCVGTYIFSYQDIINKKNNTTKKLQTAVDYFNLKIIDATRTIDLIATPLSKKKFTKEDYLKSEIRKEYERLMNKLYLEASNLQSIDILYKGEVINSTVPGLVGQKFSEKTPSTLTLIKSTSIVPGQSIFLISKEAGDFVVTATLHVNTIFSVLNLLSESSGFKINLPNISINSNLGILSENNTDNIIIDSDCGLFSMSTSFNVIQVFFNSLKQARELIVFLMVIGLLVATGYYKYGNDIVLKSAIRNGIKKKKFKPFCQAIVNDKNEIHGAEILMRWEYKNKLISPLLFISYAEKSGYIIPMTVELIENVYKECDENYALFTKPFHLSINVCPIQLSAPYADKLIELCRLFTTNPKLKNINLILEITERHILNKNQETLTTVARLRDLNVKIAIDDFGTGYSSLDNLKDFKINILKLDKTFIDNYPDLMSINLVENVLDLAKRLDVFIVAEGVETEQQANYLIKEKVHFLQGYLYHKPEPLNEFLCSYSSINERT